MYYQPTSLAKNKLIQTTSDDFYEWAEGKDIKGGQKYDTKELYNEFISIYYGDGGNLSQRGFSNWIKKLAEIRGYKARFSKSNGKSVFEFEYLST